MHKYLSEANYNNWKQYLIYNKSGKKLKASKDINVFLILIFDLQLHKKKATEFPEPFTQNTEVVTNPGLYREYFRANGYIFDNRLSDKKIILMVELLTSGMIEVKADL